MLALTRSHITYAVLLIAITLLAGLLRFKGLGNTFQSSDNLELAVRILQRPGWLWMIDEPYGLLISAWVKIWATVYSLFGMRMTELYWKAAIAMIGTIQIPVAAHWLRKLGASSWAILLGCLAIAVLPIHIFQSRYLWGYEVLGCLFILPAVATLIRFFEAPERRKGWIAGLALALYLISHGYFLPIFPMIPILAWRFSEGNTAFERLMGGMKAFFRNLAWLIPVLAFPIYRIPLKHALAKKSILGFYLDDHFLGLVGDLGWPFLVAILAAILLAFFLKKPENWTGNAFLIGFIIYLLPLMIASPPGITVVRGYMLIGCFLGIIGATLQFDRMTSIPKTWVFLTMLLLSGWTAAGTANTLFAGGNALGTDVVVERGSIPKDPCVRAAGWFMRHYDPQAQLHLAALHRAVEPPNLWYYFGRTDSAWYDLKLETTLAKSLRLREWADVLVLDPVQWDSLGKVPQFDVESIFEDNGLPQLIILSKATANLPAGHFDYASFNQRFDDEFAPNLLHFSAPKPAVQTIVLDSSYDDGILVTRRILLEQLPSASGMAQIDTNSWLVAGDDARALYVLDKYGMLNNAISLPKIKHAGDEMRIPKQLKRDYEAIASFEAEGRQQFLVIGSGAKIPERAYMVQGSYDRGRIKIQEYPCTNIYQIIMRDGNIPPESLNIEGATIVDDRLVLLNREGNLVISIALDKTLQLLDNQLIGEDLELEIYRLQIPYFADVQAGLSGACFDKVSRQLFFCASFEDKTGTLLDGEILGSCVGWVNWDELKRQKAMEPQTLHLVNESGGRLFDKLEAIELLSLDSNGLKLIGVTDADNGQSDFLQLYLSPARYAAIQTSSSTK